jgi:hypothetical protein
MKFPLPFAIGFLALTLPAAAFTYNVSQQTGGGSYAFSSSYNNFSLSTSTAPVNYLMNFDAGYSSVQFSDFVLTSPEMSFSSSASFPTGIGKPMATITTTFSLVVKLTVPTYQPTSTIYAGPGGYRLADTTSNLYSGGIITYTGSYQIKGPTETKTGTFSTAVSPSTWSNIIEYDNVSNPANDPVITFGGPGPAYDLNISKIDYKFYMGGAPFTNLFSETVDNVAIFVRPSDYQITGGSAVVPVLIPEPGSTALTAAAAVAGLCFQRRRRQESC